MQNKEDQIKTYCSFGIKAFQINCDLITQDLNINPTSSYNKGEKVVLKNGGIRERAFSVWKVESPPIISSEGIIDQHLSFFKELLSFKIDLLSKYKNSPDFEVSFYISIKTEDVGAGVDLYNEDLLFFYQICNRVTVFFGANAKIA